MAITIMTSMSVRPSMSVPSDGSRPTPPARAVMSPWRWLAVTCLLLGVSGGIRFWREWQFAALAARSEARPFPLAQLPRTMGTWQADEGSETTLDPEVARFAGASEHIVRGYIDERSGERAAALILYGLATKVCGHVPEVCYPAAGYQVVRGPIDHSITVPGVKGPVRYRWAIYTKRVGRISQYVETYCTFLHRGDWLPETEKSRWKMFRYDPGLFKVQIEHFLSSLRESGEGPCEDLLAQFVRQVNDRLPPAGKAKG
jgi:Protein of unknown function (DUF3485)